MKTKLSISILLVSLVLALFGQNVGPKKCKVCGKPFAQCQYRGKHPQKTENDTSSKPATHSTSKPSTQSVAKPSKPSNSNASSQSQRQNNSNSSFPIYKETFTVNGVSFKMVQIEGGTFTMGATSAQGNDADDDEKPAHQVTLSSYSIGETEVTQELWEAVMGSNKSRFKGLNRPVEMVSWNDCKTFISNLNAATSRGFRLPTEAEWEYASRGGNRSRGCRYSGSDMIGAVAWYEGNSGDTTHDVATKQPNELGLYDMSGNVCEWCSDLYGSYSSGSRTNPKGAKSGFFRVFRGGDYTFPATVCRPSARSCESPLVESSHRGLRLALSE